MDLVVVMEIILFLLLGTAVFCVPVAIYRYGIRKRSIDSSGTAIIATTIFFLICFILILAFCFGGDYVYDDVFPFLLIPSVPCLFANYAMLVFPKKEKKDSTSAQEDALSNPPQNLLDHIHDLQSKNYELQNKNASLTQTNRIQCQDIEALEKQSTELKKQIESLKQKIYDLEQQQTLIAVRETRISENEKKQTLWMESFEGGEGAIENTTQSVVTLYHDIQKEIDPLLTNIRALGSSVYIPSYELKKHLTNAQTVIQEQKHLLLSYTQTLASYLHHFGQRAQDLREREEQASQMEEKLLENSPYIVEKAFENIFVRTGNAFYQAQAIALNRYYERVKDKRFEKAMIEGVHYTTGPAIICRIKSNDKNHPAPYVTSLSSCTCQDYRRHKQPCKHMLFLAYHTGYLFLNKEKLEASMQQYIEELKKIK